MIMQLLDAIFHLDTTLLAFVSSYGVWTYLMLFIIIFCETGLVVTPFLPGDSLLFAAGSLAAYPTMPLNIVMLFFLLVMASILGNQVNYFLGRVVGQRAFSVNRSWLLNKKYLEEAHLFYERHGKKTIILARFIPVIRTFAPFVAGMAAMRVEQFSLYNLGSALFWIGCLLGFGYFFGSLPVIKANFSLVVYGIIIVSVSPPVLTFLYRKVVRESKV